MTHAHRLLGATACALLTLAACTKDQRTTIESQGDAAMDSASAVVRAALSVIDMDVGRGLDSAQHIMVKTEEFGPRDTIYATVHTSGTATEQAVIARLVFQDSTVVQEKTNSVTTSGDAYTLFSFTNSSGFTKGFYTLKLIVDGREVRSKEFKVM